MNYVVYILCFSVIILKCKSQVLQLGVCKHFDTVKFFDLERFLGEWYEIERYPIRYERKGHCALKRIHSCGRRIEIQHVYVLDNVEFILRINSTYAPGDEAIFDIHENKIDPVGIPLSVVATDYLNYAVIYGCKANDEYKIRYVTAWILSRTNSLDPNIHSSARKLLNSLPMGSAAYLQQVDHDETKCQHFWTAHVQGD